MPGIIVFAVPALDLGPQPIRHLIGATAVALAGPGCYPLWPAATFHSQARSAGRRMGPLQVKGARHRTMKRDIRPFTDEHRAWARALLTESWGSARVVTRGALHRADLLPGFVAHVDDRPAGLVTYRISGDECEIVTLDSRMEGTGIGTALMDAVRALARASGCRRVWLITTNDNTPALRFYQRRGFRIAAVRVDAIRESRRLKPEIPHAGIDGILIRDEVELELESP